MTLPQTTAADDWAAAAEADAAEWRAAETPPDHPAGVGRMRGQATQAERAGAYSLTRPDADTLAAALVLPTDARAEFLADYLARFGPDDLLNLFAQALGMANSVVANNREAIELFGICEGTLHPHNAHQINLPTMLGAAQGARIARDAKGMCGGCAFRLGTTANQSPITTIDAEDCARDGTPFLCHDVEPGERIRAACRGFVVARREAAHAA